MTDPYTDALARIREREPSARWGLRLLHMAQLKPGDPIPADFEERIKEGVVQWIQREMAAEARRIQEEATT